MNFSCGSCKHCEVDDSYVYPFRCKKERKGERHSMENLSMRIQQGYRCANFEFFGEPLDKTLELAEALRDGFMEGMKGE